MSCGQSKSWYKPLNIQWFTETFSSTTQIIKSQVGYT